MAASASRCPAEDRSASTKGHRVDACSAVRPLSLADPLAKRRRRAIQAEFSGTDRIRPHSQKFR
jgi:hypothetical protein